MVRPPAGQRTYGLTPVAFAGGCALSPPRVAFLLAVPILVSNGRMRTHRPLISLQTYKPRAKLERFIFVAGISARD
jgi:hypothetical protein